jgi:hypothetical protein
MKSERGREGERDRKGTEELKGRVRARCTGRQVRK